MKKTFLQMRRFLFWIAFLVCCVGCQGQPSNDRQTKVQSQSVTVPIFTFQKDTTLSDFVIQYYPKERWTAFKSKYGRWGELGNRFNDEAYSLIRAYLSYRNEDWDPFLFKESADGYRKPRIVRALGGRTNLESWTYQGESSFEYQGRSFIAFYGEYKNETDGQFRERYQEVLILERLDKSQVENPGWYLVSPMDEDEPFLRQFLSILKQLDFRTFSKLFNFAPQRAQETFSSQEIGFLKQLNVILRPSKYPDTFNYGFDLSHLLAVFQRWNSGEFKDGEKTLYEFLTINN